jgi:hypothetical protein
MPQMERFRMCEVPRGCALLPHHGLADAITPDQVLAVVNAARLLRSDGSAVETAEKYLSFDRTERIRIRFRSPPTGLQLHG